MRHSFWVIQVFHLAWAVCFLRCSSSEHVVDKNPFFGALSWDVELTIPILDTLFPITLIKGSVHPVHFSVPVPQVLR